MKMESPEMTRHNTAQTPSAKDSAITAQNAPNPLSLCFPISRHETATSYASRLTRHCGQDSPNDLCLDFGFRWQDFVRGDDALFEKLARIGGASAPDMKRWAIRTIARNRFQVSGQVATKNALVRSRIRLCPRCIIADRERDGPHAPYRRHFWHFWSMRSCPRHACPLIALSPEKYTILNYHFLGQIEQHWSTVAAHANANDHRPTTALEHYILERLEGQTAHVFLDDMPMFIATRLCEVLGFVTLFGPDRKISSASDDELSQAGQSGFEALQSGEDGLYAAMDRLVSPLALKTIHHQADFGALFEWLRSSTLGPEFDPLKDKIRAYFFRTYPFREGDRVLGAPCPASSKFTIHKAWKTLGIQRKRMNRILIAQGIARKDNKRDEIQLNDGIGPKDIERISEQMAARLNSVQAQELLSVSSNTLKQLREQGILKPIIDEMDQRPKYARQDIEQFISQLSKQVIDNLCPPDNDATTLIDACRKLRCPCSEIIQLILDRKLKTLWRDKRVTGLAGFKISLTELRHALPPLEMKGTTKGEAARLLRVSYPTINYLIAEGLLTSIRARNPKSRQFLDAVCNDSLGAFQAEYETLGHLAKRYSRPSGPFGCHLEAQDICPIETPKGISWIFKRRGLEARLRKSGIFICEN